MLPAETVCCLQAKAGLLRAKWAAAAAAGGSLAAVAYLPPPWPR